MSSAGAAGDNDILVPERTTGTRSLYGQDDNQAGKHGRQQPLTQCGILMHSSVTVTADGLPFGVAAIKFRTRSKFKGCNALKRKIN